MISQTVDYRFFYLSSKIVLGKIVANDAELDLDLACTLLDLGKGLPFDVVTGKTVCTNDFYEGI